MKTIYELKRQYPCLGNSKSNRWQENGDRLTLPDYQTLKIGMAFLRVGLSFNKTSETLSMTATLTQWCQESSLTIPLDVVGVSSHQLNSCVSEAILEAIKEMQDELKMKIDKLDGVG